MQFDVSCSDDGIKIHLNEYLREFAILVLNEEVENGSARGRLLKLLHASGYLDYDINGRFIER